MTNQAFLSALSHLLSQKEQVVLAIDGPCTAGKSTLAEAISRRFDAAVIPMDDFFLRPEQKTPERLAEIGGHFDRERFLDEVLSPLSKGEPIRYRPYDCHTGEFSAPRSMERKPLTVIEGTYSLHPALGKYYDLSVFLWIPTLVQLQRVLKRPKEKHDRFLREWIPMEESYFSEFQIQASADFSIEGIELESLSF